MLSASHKEICPQNLDYKIYLDLVTDFCIRRFPRVASGSIGDGKSQQWSYEYERFRSGQNVNFLCWLFTINDLCKKLLVSLMHNEGLHQLFLTVSWDLHA